MSECKQARIGVLPSWIRTALRIAQTEREPVPTMLDTSRIVAVMDAFQRGWVQAEFNHFGNVIKGAGVGASTHEIVWQDFPVQGANVNTDHQRFIMAASCARVGGSGTARVTLEVHGRPATFTGPSPGAVPIEYADIAAGALYVFTFNTGRPLWIPPGVNARWSLPATAAGENFSIQWWEARLPLDFVPGP